MLLKSADVKLLIFLKSISLKKVSFARLHIVSLILFESQSSNNAGDLE